MTPCASIARRAPRSHARELQRFLVWPSVDLRRQSRLAVSSTHLNLNLRQTRPARVRNERARPIAGPALSLITVPPEPLRNDDPAELVHRQVRIPADGPNGRAHAVRRIARVVQGAVRARLEDPAVVRQHLADRAAAGPDAAFRNALRHRRLSGQPRIDHHVVLPRLCHLDDARQIPRRVRRQRAVRGIAGRARHPIRIRFFAQRILRAGLGSPWPCVVLKLREFCVAKPPIERPDQRIDTGHDQ